MSETKHTPGPRFTPGPWETSAIQVPGEGVIWDVCRGDNLDMLADLRGFDNAEANACLIAAAPDLYAALQCVVRGLTNGQKERGETLESIARAAIAKAEGGGGEVSGVEADTFEAHAKDWEALADASERALIIICEDYVHMMMIAMALSLMNWPDLMAVTDDVDVMKMITDEYIDACLPMGCPHKECDGEHKG